MSTYIILHLCIIVFSVFFFYWEDSIIVHFYIALECLILFMLFHIILHCTISSFIAFHCMPCVFPYYIVLYYILDCIVLFLCTLHCGLYSCFVLF